MMIPLPKIKAILLYFCSFTDQKFLGKVKLMKLFYFLDFIHVKLFGLPVSYDRYVNLEHGPIPSSIKNLVDSVADDPDNSLLSDVISVEKTEGMNIHRVVAKRPFQPSDEKYFSGTEMEVLKKVCARFGDKNTKFIEDASHQEAPWKETSQLEDIPYSLAARDGDCEVDDDEIMLLGRLR